MNENILCVYVYDIETCDQMIHSKVIFPLVSLKVCIGQGV